MKKYLDNLVPSTPDARDTVRDWLTADQLCPTYEVLSDTEILQSVQGNTDVTQSENVERSDESESESDEPKPPSTSEAISGFECGLRWLESRGDVDPVKIIQVRNILFYARRKKLDGLSQPSIADFYKH